MSAGEQTRDQRRQERFRIDRQPDGELHLRVGDSRHAVRGVRDVSGSGISIFLDVDLAVPAPVAIEYAEPNLKLEVFGTVVWCEPRGGRADVARADSGYVSGIALLSPMLLAALLQKHA
jgi:hypothetical protein